MKNHRITEFREHSSTGALRWRSTSPQILSLVILSMSLSANSDTCKTRETKDSTMQWKKEAKFRETLYLAKRFCWQHKAPTFSWILQSNTNIEGQRGLYNPGQQRSHTVSDGKDTEPRSLLTPDLTQATYLVSSMPFLGPQWTNNTEKRVDIAACAAYPRRTREPEANSGNCLGTKGPNKSLGMQYLLGVHLIPGKVSEKDNFKWQNGDTISPHPDHLASWLSIADVLSLLSPLLTTRKAAHEKHGLHNGDYGAIVPQRPRRTQHCHSDTHHCGDPTAKEELQVWQTKVMADQRSRFLATQILRPHSESSSPWRWGYDPQVKDSALCCAHPHTHTGTEDSIAWRNHLWFFYLLT